MMNSFRISAIALLAAATTAVTVAAYAKPKQAEKAKAAEVAKPADPALVEAYLKATFGKESPEWQAKIVPDETLKTCNKFHNNVPSAEAAKIMKREAATVVYPADGKYLGDWKAGDKIAQSGFGGRYSDKPGTINGGNCYACHQLGSKELSYGTIGPSLNHYGRDRKFDAAEAKTAYAKIYNSQAALACSNMPRFGTNKVLDEQQIKDLVALLFDPESPVNK